MNNFNVRYVRNGYINFDTKTKTLDVHNGWLFIGNKCYTLVGDKYKTVNYVNHAIPTDRATALYFNTRTFDFEVYSDHTNPNLIPEECVLFSVQFRDNIEGAVTYVDFPGTVTVDGKILK